MQAQEKEAQSPGKIGPKPGWKQAQTQTKRAPNGAKLYSRDPYILEAHRTNTRPRGSSRVRPHP